MVGRCGLFAAAHAKQIRKPQISSLPKTISNKLLVLIQDTPNPHHISYDFVLNSIIVLNYIIQNDDKKIMFIHGSNGF